MEHLSARYPTEIERGRFDAKTKSSEDGCIEWIGAKISAGYGYFRFDDQAWRVHRLAWAWQRGPIPAGLTLDHLCRKRACVNVAHLELVTRGENVLRGDTITAANARKQQCKRGHENWGKQHGGRYCKTCAAERQLARNRAVGVRPRGSQTNCVHGHPFDERNTYRAADGSRRCRICNRERARRLAQLKE